MCQFCQEGYRAAARDMATVERLGITNPERLPSCPYRDAARAVPWVQGYLTYLHKAKIIAAYLDDPDCTRHDNAAMRWLSSGLIAKRSTRRALDLAR